MIPEPVWRWWMEEFDPAEHQLNARQVAVLNALIMHADERGLARPGTRRIAAKAGCSQTPARRALDALVAAGLVLAAPGGFGKGTTVYALTMGRSAREVEATLFGAPQTGDNPGDILFLPGSGRIAPRSPGERAHPEPPALTPRSPGEREPRSLRAHQVSSKQELEPTTSSELTASAHRWRQIRDGLRRSG